MAKEAKQVGELIAVLSGKGGTGKTSLCAGVASALAQMGEKVLCIDCDVGLRNLDISLGISARGPPGAITWAPTGNHVGSQGQSRGPPGEITWAPMGNHVQKAIILPLRVGWM